MELFPAGVSIEAGEFASPNRPVMFFKDKEKKHVLPVWLSPVEAGIVLSENSQRLPQTSPHHLTAKIFDQLDISLTHCIFTELKGHYQYVNLHFEGSDKFKIIESRADQSMSLCLNSKVKFYCKKSFIQESKILDASLLDLPGYMGMKSRISDNLKNKYLN